MYDIVETIKQGDSIFYYCWWDHQETKLNKELAKLLSYFLGNDSKSNDNKKRVAQFFKTFFIRDKQVTYLGLDKEINQNVSDYVFNYKSRYIYPPFNPPQNLI